jgi:hypothetical protein
VITEQREFRARFKKYILMWCAFFKPCTIFTLLCNHKSGHLKTESSPAAAPSWKLVPRTRNKHERRTAGSAGGSWTVPAAYVMCCPVEDEEYIFYQRLKTHH